MLSQKIPTLLQASLRVLHVLGSILFLWAIAGAFLWGGPKPKVSCIADNRPATVAEKQPDGSVKEHDEDDWYVTCEIREGDKILYAPHALPLAHRTTFRDAMLAIEEWRKNDAPRIMKELKYKEKS